MIWRASHPSTCPRFESNEKRSPQRAQGSTEEGTELRCDRLSRESQSLNWSGSFLESGFVSGWETVSSRVRVGFFGLTFIGYLLRRAVDESRLPSSKQPECFDSAWVARDVWNEGRRSSTGRGWFAEVEVPILEPVLHRWQRCSSSAPPKKTNPIEWSSVQDYEPFRVTMCDVTHREFASD
jgi:hypothetical protein